MSLYSFAFLPRKHYFALLYILYFFIAFAFIFSPKEAVSQQQAEQSSDSPIAFFQLSLAKAYRQAADYKTTRYPLQLRRKASLAGRGIPIQPSIPEASNLEPHVKRRMDAFLQRLEPVILNAKTISGDITAAAATAQSHFDCFLANVYAPDYQRKEKDLCYEVFILALRAAEKISDDIDLESITAERLQQKREENLKKALLREGTENSPFSPASQAALLVEEWYTGREDDARERYIALEEIISAGSAAAGVSQTALLGALQLADEIAARESLTSLTDTLNRAGGAENAFLAESRTSGGVLELPDANITAPQILDDAIARAEESDTVLEIETLISQESTLVPDDNIQSALALLEGEEIKVFDPENKNAPRIASLDGERQALIWVLHFDYEVTRLDDDIITTLPVIVEVVKQTEDPVILVMGHTDRRGDADVNLRFSRKRANNIRDELIKEGIAPNAIIAHGFGEERPVIKTEDGIKNNANRRVVVTVLR